MRIWKDPAPPKPQNQAVLKGKPTFIILIWGKSHQAIIPNVSQHLNCVMSYAGLQELKKTPDHKIKRAEHKRPRCWAQRLKYWAQRSRWGGQRPRWWCQDTVCKTCLKDLIPPHHSLCIQKAPSLSRRRCHQSASSPFSIPRSKKIKASALLDQTQFFIHRCECRWAEGPQFDPWPRRVGNKRSRRPPTRWVTQMASWQAGQKPSIYIAGFTGLSAPLPDGMLGTCFICKAVGLQ